MPGPASTWDQNIKVDDGTSCRMPSRTPGPSERMSPSPWARGKAVYEAYERAQVLAPAAVLQTTGYALGELLKNLLPGMLQMLIILGASTALGAAAGGVIGFFFGGAGAAPGAVLGGELGFDFGTAILTWMGVAFLAKAIVEGLGQIWAKVSEGVTIAWSAPEFSTNDYPHRIEQAAQDLANAVGIFVLVILQGIVAWVFARAGVGATESALATGRSMSALGSEAAADEAVGAVVEQLKGSRLGPYFADWVEKNWPRLKEDPKLRFKARPPAEAADLGTSSSSGPLRTADVAADRAGTPEAGGRAEEATKMTPTEPRGARGPSSGREFDPDAAGGPIEPKTTDGVTIDHAGIDVVEQHVSRFGPDPHNEAMISRLRAIADGKLEPTQEDLNFYTHEMDEFQRYKNLGWETGQPDDPDSRAELWNNAHTAALEDYGLREVAQDPISGETRSTLYHPDCDPRSTPEGWTPPDGWPFTSGSEK
jgi:hypothetical protein